MKNVKKVQRLRLKEESGVKADEIAANTNSSSSTLKSVLVVIVFSFLGAIAGGMFYQKYFAQKIYEIDIPLLESLGYSRQDIKQVLSEYQGLSHDVVLDKSVILNSPKQLHDLTPSVVQALRSMKSLSHEVQQGVVPNGSKK